MMQCSCGGYAPSRYHERVDGTKVVTWQCEGCGRRKVIERKPEADQKPEPGMTYDRDTLLREEALRCIKDVCMYCDGRALGYEPAEGPNGAGNWTHKWRRSKGRAGSVLCAASPIWSRITYRAALRDTEER